MSNATNPRALFQEDQVRALDFNSTVKDKKFQTALTYAKAEFMGENGMTQEQILGAQKFEKILLTLGEVIPEMPSMPNKNLKPEQPTKPNKKK